MGWARTAAFEVQVVARVHVGRLRGLCALAVAAYLDLEDLQVAARLGQEKRVKHLCEDSEPESR